MACFHGVSINRFELGVLTWGNGHMKPRKR